MLTGFDIATADGAALPLELDSVGLSGCRLWIDPLIGEVRRHSGSSLATSLAIPNVPGLEGLAVMHQAVVLDPAAPNGIGAVSNAGVAVVGPLS